VEESAGVSWDALLNDKEVDGSFETRRLMRDLKLESHCRFALSFF